MDRAEQRKQYWFVIRELTSREIKRKYSRSKLGIVWSVLNPLLTMVVMSMIFSYMFKRSIEHYPVYYLCGSILWNLFTGSTNSAMTSLVDNRLMLIKVKFPMQIFILARVYTAVVNFLYSSIAFVAVVCVFRILPNPMWLFIPIVVFLLTIFALGISYILATAYVFFGDVKHLYSVLLTLWLYMSAIFYPIEQLPDFLQKVIRFNPIYNYIDCLRSLVLHATMPPTVEIIKIIIWAASSYLIGYMIFKMNQNQIMQKL